MKLGMEANKKDGGGKDRMRNQNDFKTVMYSVTGRLTEPIFAVDNFAFGIAHRAVADYARNARHALSFHTRNFFYGT